MEYVFESAMRYLLAFFLTLVLVLVCPPAGFAASPGFDHSRWDAFLKKFVSDQGDVDYAAVKRDPSLLNDYLGHLAAQDPLEVKDQWLREEGMAFWINAYNAGVVKLVVEHYPVKNINQISSVWDITIVHVGKEQYSLNQIRNEKLLASYRDEKIHFALACGARGCPPLSRDAFTAPNVEGKLFLATRAFLNDPRNVEIVPGKKKIWLSRLFKWYGKDFNLDFGTPERIAKFSREEMSVLSFLIYYLEDQDKIEFLEEGRYKIAYKPFEPVLNDWETPALSVPPAPEDGMALPPAVTEAKNASAKP